MFKLMVLGRLTNESNLLTSANGTNYTQNCVAYNQKDKSGKEFVWFINFSLFSKNAEYFAKASKKGGRVLLEGTLAQETYTDKNMQEQTRLVLKNISNFEIIDFADDYAPMQNNSSSVVFAKEKQSQTIQQTQEIECEQEKQELPF